MFQLKWSEINACGQALSEAEDGNRPGTGEPVISFQCHRRTKGHKCAGCRAWPDCYPNKRNVRDSVFVWHIVACLMTLTLRIQRNSGLLLQMICLLILCFQRTSNVRGRVLLWMSFLTYMIIYGTFKDWRVLELTSTAFLRVNQVFVPCQLQSDWCAAHSGIGRAKLAPLRRNYEVGQYLYLCRENLSTRHGEDAKYERQCVHTAQSSIQYDTMIQPVKITWTSQTLALIPGFVVGKLEPQRHEFRPEITAISISLENM